MPRSVAAQQGKARRPARSPNSWAASGEAQVRYRLRAQVPRRGTHPPPAQAVLADPATPCYRLAYAAGWSSQVARRAHNPEVTGSNPVPAIGRSPLMERASLVRALHSQLARGINRASIHIVRLLPRPVSTLRRPPRRPDPPAHRIAHGAKRSGKRLTFTARTLSLPRASLTKPTVARYSSLQSSNS